MSAAFVPGPYGDVPPDAGVLLGVAWLRSFNRPHRVLVPTMRNYLDSAPLQRRVRRAEVTTMRTQSQSALYRGGAAVLGCWPTEKELEVLHRRALAGDPVCIVRWDNGVAERAWINSTQAVNLKTGHVGDDRHPIQLDPVAQVALRSLSSSVNLGSWHVLDENRIKWVLLNAPRQGHRYDADSLFEWVLLHGLFPWHQATKLRKLATRVCEGGTFQLRGRQPFRADIWDKWRAEAETEIPAPYVEQVANGEIASP